MPDIVCFKDAGGRWLVANDFAIALFGLEGVDYIGRPDLELAEYSPF
jgi:PAS domain-containing protein